MKQGCDCELVALRQACQVGGALAGDANRRRVAAEAFLAIGSLAGLVEDVVGVDAIDEGAYRSGLERLDCLSDTTRAPGRALAVVGSSHQRDRQGRVGLDRFGDVVGRNRLTIA